MALVLPELPPIPDSERTPLVEALLQIIEIQRTLLNAQEERLQLQEQRIAELESENALLKERIARLEKNSSNSSKPPSSDITKPKKEQRQRGKRKIGAQPGHKANLRRKFEDEEIDRREQLTVSQCPDCQARLEQEMDAVIIHHQAELVEKPVIITEYQLQGSFCPCCNKTVYPSLPEGVIPGQLLGPRLLSLFGYMKAAMGISITELGEFSAEVFNLALCRGAVQKAIFRASDALAPAYQELGQAVPQQKALHIDETGWKENGKRQWVWLFCNQMIAFFVISKSRSCQVLNEILGENFLGALTSDFYSAYTKYASPKQQFCLAHLIRELKFLTTLPDEETKRFGMKLLAYMRRLFKLWHSRDSYTPEIWHKKTQRYKRDLQRYIFSHCFEKGTDARRIQRRFIKHWPALFRFLDSPQLYEPTNNHAERTLRPLVRLRRISQGSRGKPGSLWIARAASVVATCRLQNRSAWEFFQKAVYSRYFSAQAPSLLCFQN